MENYFDDRNLIVNRIPHCVSARTFFDLFKPFGPIEKYRLVQKKISDIGNYVNCGYGFVKYESANDASEAIRTLNGLKICSNRLRVSYSRKIPGTTVFVEGVNKKWNNEDLKNFMANFGPIISTRILRPRLAPQDEAAAVVCAPSTRNAFVVFEFQDDAFHAIRVLHGATMGNQNEPLKLRVTSKTGDANRLMMKAYEQELLCCTPMPAAEYYIVEIKYLDGCFTIDYLYCMFGRYGAVLDSFIVVDNHMLTGCVVMKSYIDAIKAITDLQLASYKTIRIFTKCFPVMYYMA